MRRYLHGLAERLGCTVRELGCRMTVTELVDWIAYDRLAEAGVRADGAATPIIGDD